MMIEENKPPYELIEGDWCIVVDKLNPENCTTYFKEQGKTLKFETNEEIKKFLDERGD